MFDGEGGARGFVGTYEEYREAAEAEAREGGKKHVLDSPPREPARRPARAQKAGLSFKERKEYEGLMAEIETLETEQKALEESVQKETVDPEREKRTPGDTRKSCTQSKSGWPGVGKRRPRGGLALTSYQLILLLL